MIVLHQPFVAGDEGYTQGTTPDAEQPATVVTTYAHDPIAAQTRLARDRFYDGLHCQYNNFCSMHISSPGFIYLEFCTKYVVSRFACWNTVYMGTTLPGLLLSVPYSVSEERSPAPDTC
jgi:hypothetical protein